MEDHRVIDCQIQAFRRAEWFIVILVLDARKQIFGRANKSSTILGPDNEGCSSPSKEAFFFDSPGLALARLKVPYAGYLLSGNRSNFID